MAMDFGLFRFASPPRTATSWIKQAAVMCGLTELEPNKVHVPHDLAEKNTIKLSTVRHPCSWLASYYVEIYPGVVGIPEVDCFRPSLCIPTFDAFVRSYLMDLCSVGLMFKAYNADVCLRVEDLPWAFIEFLESLGVPKKMRERCLALTPQNSSKRERHPTWSPSLRARVLEAERAFLQEYHY